MSIGNLVWGVSSGTVSYLIRYDSLLQNATDTIRKCLRIVSTTNASGLLQMLQVFYYKIRQFYYNLGQYSP